MRRVFQLPLYVAGAVLTAMAPLPEASAEVTLVRLTPDEYKRTIQDVFGTAIRVEENKVAPGVREEGLLAVGERKLTVSSAELERYADLARDIASQVVEPRRRDTLVQCKPNSEKAPDNVCATSFIKRVGLFLFRRPLTDDEVQYYVKTHGDAAKKLESFNAGISAALSQMLVDPMFLFRIERSEPDPADPAKLRLDPYSMASRLSFFLWDSAPDAELLAAARSGKLSTPEGLKQQVDRMLSSPRVEHGVRAFFSDMLGFDHFATLSIDTTLYSKFTKNVQEDAQEQTLLTVVDHLLNKGGDYRDLFTTRETFLTPALAALYEVPLARSQELGGAVPWVRYQFPESAPYVGLLSQVSFLSLHSHPGRSSPTLRGKALREIFLCQKVPPPPGEVDFNLVQDTNNPKFKTVRQRLTAHSAEAMCAGCHKITDPMGLALENFNTASEFRTHENGEPIDATGSLNGKNFDGIAELAQVVRNDPLVTSCLVNRAYSYGTARKPTAEERKWLTSVQSELGQEGVKWRELMRHIASNPDFYTVPAAAVASPLSAQTGK